MICIIIVEDRHDPVLTIDTDIAFSPFDILSDQIPGRPAGGAPLPRVAGLRHELSGVCIDLHDPVQVFKSRMSDPHHHSYPAFSCAVYSCLLLFLLKLPDACLNIYQYISNYGDSTSAMEGKVDSFLHL